MRKLSDKQEKAEQGTVRLKTLKNAIFNHLPSSTPHTFSVKQSIEFPQHKMAAVHSHVIHGTPGCSLTVCYTDVTSKVTEAV